MSPLTLGYISIFPYHLLPNILHNLLGPLCIYLPHSLTLPHSSRARTFVLFTTVSVSFDYVLNNWMWAKVMCATLCLVSKRIQVSAPLAFSLFLLAERWTYTEWSGEDNAVSTLTQILLPTNSEFELLVGRNVLLDHISHCVWGSLCYSKLFLWKSISFSPFHIRYNYFHFQREKLIDRSQVTLQEINLVKIWSVPDTGTIENIKAQHPSLVDTIW